MLTALRSFAIGPVTAILIITFLTQETQGFYYYFRSLLGFGAAAEFGMTGMLVPLVSHEWTHLRYERGRLPEGSAESLARWTSLTRSIMRFYVLVGPLLGTVLFLVAYHNLPSTSVNWQMAWICTCLLSVVEFSIRPLLSMLEGCQQVAAAFRIRLWQGLIASVVLWCVLANGGGLWCLPASLLATALLGLAPLVEYPEIFKAFWIRSEGKTIGWWREIWPMQWRLGLAALCANGASSLVVPIVFHLCGPTEAGRFGLSLVLCQIVATLTSVWVQTKSARLARLVALGESGELHRTLYQTLLIGSAAGIVSAMAAECGVALLHVIHSKYADRMLGEFPSAILLLAAVVSSFHAPLAFYLRAHRFEPYLGTSLLSATLTLILTWWLASQYGVVGGCWAQLAAGLIILPPTFWIWYRFRRERYR